MWLLTSVRLDSNTLLKQATEKSTPKDRGQGKIPTRSKIPKHISIKYVLKPNFQDWIPNPTRTPPQP